MSLGKSLNQFAHNIGVVVATLHRWEDTYPQFAHAMDRAKQASLAFWEDRLEEYIEDKDINNQLVKLLFAHRFKWFDSRPKELEYIPEDRPTVEIKVTPSQQPFELNEEQKPNVVIH